MKKYNLTADDVIMTKTSSKGSQIKLFKDNYWYKLDTTGYEGITEYLVSGLLRYSNATHFVEERYV